MNIHLTKVIPVYRPFNRVEGVESETPHPILVHKITGTKQANTILISALPSGKSNKIHQIEDVN